MENKILVKAVIAYDGSKFYGLQIQPDKKTVIGSIHNALKKIKIYSKVDHAGRTDKGVHALNHIVTFQIPFFWDLEKLKIVLNKILMPEIYFKKLYIVADNFHPRKNIKKRSYRYVLSPYTNPFIDNYITYYPKKIDTALLKQSLNLLIGKHDFQFFAKTGSSVNHYKREIYNAYILPYKQFIIIKITGNGFLRGQIRIIINFLLQINEKKLTISDLEKQLNKKKLINKDLAAPNGLYLERIWYKI